MAEVFPITHNPEHQLLTDVGVMTSACGITAYLGAAFPKGNYAFSQKQAFPWPEGKKMALSLSFDDARTSNPNLGATLLNKYDIKVTFFLVLSGVRRNLEDWKKAVSSGHEMAKPEIKYMPNGKPLAGLPLWIG